MVMGVLTYSTPNAIRLPPQATCSCSHRLVRPVQTRKRLVHRQSVAHTSQHSFSLSRRRVSRSCAQVVVRAAQEDAEVATQEETDVATQEEEFEEEELPAGYIRYETMLILDPDLNDELRDVELAKFEAFLNREQCKDIRALVRGRQQLSYPIHGHWSGIYVLYSYGAKRATTPKVQKFLSKSTAGTKSKILRHMTFCT